MDQRTSTDLAILSGHYLRNSGPVAFIDESYASSSGDSAGGFYLLSAVVYEEEVLNQARLKNNLASKTSHWHTTDQNDKGNQRAVHALAEAVGDQAMELVVAGLLDLRDLGLEKARQRCMANLLAYLNEKDCKLLIYERRALRSDVNSDSALVNKLRKQGLIGQNTRVIPSSPSAENLLWSADLLAWAIRRLLTHAETKWIRSISKTIGFIEATEPERSLGKEKRPGPAVACPGPGLSVTHKSEGINRSSRKSFSHQNTISQAFRELLVNRIEPLVS
jgi:hypothetical protein